MTREQNNLTPLAGGGTGKAKLYTGLECHLCQLARDILDEVLGPGGYREVCISDNAELKETYGTRIPVVASANGAEKNWPFSTGQVRRLLAK